MKSSFKSSYTDRLVTAPQYLAELMCERLAAKEGKGDLPIKFWTLPKWKRTFLYQVQVANGLLKLYSIKAILNVLRQNPLVYSLNAQFLDPAIKQEHAKLERQIPVEPVEDKLLEPVVEKPRPSFTEKKSTLSKLKDL